MCPQTEIPIEHELAAEWISVEALHPWADNPRENAKAIGKVAESIRRFGFGAPIVARRADGQIIAGHTRFEAARRLKLDRVPVRFLDLDPADARLLALADNKLGEIATWDTEALERVLSEFRVDDRLFAGFDPELVPDGSQETADGSASINVDGFAVVIDCGSEQEQIEVLQLCEAKGWKCRALVT